MYLVVASPFLFMLVVYVIQRWTATGASYQFVLFPIVSVIGGALLLGEDVTIFVAARSAVRPRGGLHRSPLPIGAT